MKASLPRDYFDELYAKNPDPWNFASKRYEHEKYLTTLENLPKPHYRQTLELGCSIGVLSEMLSSRTKRLLSVDAAQVALDQAKQRCVNIGNIRFERATLPAEFPEEEFDLVLMSEVGYYFNLLDLKLLSEKILHALKPEGDLVLVHYLPFVPDYPLTGDQVHEFFLQLPVLNHIEGFRAKRYRFDSFRKRTS